MVMGNQGFEYEEDVGGMREVLSSRASSMVGEEAAAAARAAMSPTPTPPTQERERTPLLPPSPDPMEGKHLLRHFIYLMLFACIPVVLLLSVALWAVSLHPQAFPRQISRLFSSHHLPDVSAVMNREDMASPRICSEHPQQCAELRILSLNVWGIPETFGSSYKAERMSSLASALSRTDADLVALEELWMESDHAMLEEALKESGGFNVTGYRQLATAECEGWIGPLFCSGLAIASRLPMDEVSFSPFSDLGDMSEALVDGEVLARKGVGRVRVSLLNGGITVDLLVTHTAADPSGQRGYDNSLHRKHQAREILKKHVRKSDADVVVLAGDLNSPPNGGPYQIIRSEMSNAMEEALSEEWLSPFWGSFGNPRNYFTGADTASVLYDYIFYEGKSEDVKVEVANFTMPWLKAQSEGGIDISISDHEAVAVTLNIWKL